MVKEFNPYKVYSTKLLSLLDDCRRKKDPALWLYNNGARTTFFMLEALSRILYKALDDEANEKWNKVFKSLEDHLGEIDHYDVLFKQFSKNKNIPIIQLDYLDKKREKAIRHLNKDLKKNDYYKKFIISFTKSAKFNFNDKQLLLKLEQRIMAELNECQRFFNEFARGFDDMETEVHELRRKLRWVSIYGQSLQGAVVLKKSTKKYKWEKEFLTKEVIKSPYNKLPVKKGLTYYIHLNKSAFYALSYVIQELGRIKDRGLGIEALAKTIQKTSAFNKLQARQLAYDQLEEHVSEEKLLEEAHTLLLKFFNTYKLHKLISNAG